MNIAAMVLAELQAARVERRQILAELRQLREVLGVVERRRPDPEQDARLLSVLASTFGGAVFTSDDLELRAQQDPALEAVLAGVGGRALGAWLRRIHRTATGEYALRKVQRVGVGWLWALDVCRDIHTRAGAAGARRLG